MDKSSLAPEGTSIAFRMDKEKGFTWEGVYDSLQIEGSFISGESQRTENEGC